MAAEAVTFKPRQSLVRTPPSGLSTPPPLVQLQEQQSVGPKRPLGSPEEVQDSVRRRMNERRQALAAQPRPSTSSSVPPQIAQQTRSAPSVTPADVGLAAKSKVQLLEMVYAAINKLQATKAELEISKRLFATSGPVQCSQLPRRLSRVTRVPLSYRKVMPQSLCRTRVLLLSSTPQTRLSSRPRRRRRPCSTR